MPWGELGILEKHLRNASNFFEFGTGASTVPLGWRCWKPGGAQSGIATVSWQTVHYCWVSGSYILLYIGSSLLAVTVSTKQSTIFLVHEGNSLKFHDNPFCRAPLFFAASAVALPNFLQKPMPVLHTAFLSSSPSQSLKTRYTVEITKSKVNENLTDLFINRVTSNNWHSSGMLSGTVSGIYSGTYLLPSGKQT